MLAALAACEQQIDAEREAFCLTAVHELVIDGGAEGFHSVSGIAWGEDGTLFVLDGGDSHLIAYDSAGRELWRRGRAGDGPGEMRNAQGLAFRGGLLAVRDIGAHRMSFWRATGEPQAIVSLADFGFEGFPYTASALSVDRVLAMVMPPRVPGSTAGSSGAVVVGTRGSARVDTLATFTFPAPLMVRADGGSMLMYPPLAAFPQATSGPEGSVYISRDGSYVIERFGPGGEPLDTLRGPSDAAPVTAADRERAFRGLPPGVRPEDVPLPNSLPAVAGLRVSSEGNLLVHTKFRDGDLVRWDRWESGEDYRDSLMLPADFGWVELRGDRLAVIEQDSLEVPFVGVYRLSGTAPCAPPLPA